MASEESSQVESCRDLGRDAMVMCRNPRGHEPPSTMGATIQCVAHNGGKNSRKQGGLRDELRWLHKTQVLPLLEPMQNQEHPGMKA